MQILREEGLLHACMPVTQLMSIRTEPATRIDIVHAGDAGDDDDQQRNVDHLV